MEMYRFLESTAGQYMTPTVKSLTRDCTMSEAEKLFDQHDYSGINPSPGDPRGRGGIF